MCLLLPLRSARDDFLCPLVAFTLDVVFPPTSRGSVSSHTRQYHHCRTSSSSPQWLRSGRVLSSLHEPALRIHRFLRWRHSPNRRHFLYRLLQTVVEIGQPRRSRSLDTQRASYNGSCILRRSQSARNSQPVSRGFSSACPIRCAACSPPA